MLVCAHRLSRAETVKVAVQTLRHKRLLAPLQLNVLLRINATNYEAERMRARSHIVPAAESTACRGVKNKLA